MNTKQLAMALIAGFGLFLGVGAAQITAPVVAEVPFPFVVGNTTLDAGKYIITMLDDEEVEIHSAQGRAAVDHTVIPAEARHSPNETELIFHRYGDKEFLTKVFLEGDSGGIALTQSKLEKELIAKGQKAVIHSHPAKRHMGKMTTS